LDEATSALDIATEGKILNRIVKLEPRPTIVMIAHREIRCQNSKHQVPWQFRSSA
jgi:ABC-type multidrug transport system fused ATPase/permease subunit